jgi:hypothetical protein
MPHTDNNVLLSKESSTYKLALDITKLLEPSFPDTSVIAVGSYPLKKELAKDIDIEIFGVPKDKIIDSLNTLRDNGAISIDTLGGNSYVIAFCKDRSGMLINISMPYRLTGIPNRYNNENVIADPSLSYREAWLRRDFTINSIGINPLTKEILDPHNGLSDYSNRVLKTTNPYFGSDPIEIIRAFKVAVELGFNMEQSLIGSITHYIDTPSQRNINNFDADRYAYELSTIFSGNQDAGQVLSLMNEVGVLFKILPELLPMMGDRNLNSIFMDISRIQKNRNEYKTTEELLASSIKPLMNGLMNRSNEHSDKDEHILKDSIAFALAQRLTPSYLQPTIKKLLTD